MAQCPKILCITRDVQPDTIGFSATEVHFPCVAGMEYSDAEEHYAHKNGCDGLEVSSLFDIHK